MHTSNRNPRTLAKAAALILAVSVFPALMTASAKETPEKPNIVVILCDDLGYGDLENYGHPHIKTPHLNQMAQEGIRFTEFYSAAPVCSPARVGLLTGRSPNRAGVYDWIPPKSGVHMRGSEVTIPQLLKKAGYATCMSGKWHCNGIFNSDEQAQPDTAGFDHWFATHNNAKPSHQNPKNFVRNGEEVGLIEGFSCQIVVDEALQWLTAHGESNPEQPFFLYVAFHEPHEPIASPKELVNEYLADTKNEDQAQYFANVANMDAAVGKLLAGLKERDLDQDTLVIFTSDNGPETLDRYPTANRSFGIPGPLRGMKLWTTEAGFRVPGIMRWPARIKGGTEESAVVSSLDFLPTFCELAGVQPPDNLNLDGTSFLPLLNGQPMQREKPLVWAYYRALNERQVAMRDGDWKVLAKLKLPRADSPKSLKSLNKENIESVRTAELTDFQVFNVAEDIGEENDLSETDPERSSELMERLKRHYRELLDDSFVWGSGN